MAVNHHGVMAAVLNRVGSLGPEPGKRSRGELPLLALQAASAAEAAARIAGWDAAQWRPFNLVLADRHGGHYVEGLGEGSPRVTTLPPGLSMVTAYPPNDTASPRTARHLPRWRAAPAPDSRARRRSPLPTRSSLASTEDVPGVVCRAARPTHASTCVSLNFQNRPTRRPGSAFVSVQGWRRYYAARGGSTG
jgi:hypothetical protein